MKVPQLQLLRQFAFCITGGWFAAVILVGGLLLSVLKLAQLLRVSTPAMYLENQSAQWRKTQYATSYSQLMQRGTLKCSISVTQTNFAKSRRKVFLRTKTVAVTF
jgi:hypothetical protein